MGGRIECYLDICKLRTLHLPRASLADIDTASLYSYVAFVQLQKIRELLAAHSVEFE
jgi:hypothetical protein